MRVGSYGVMHPAEFGACALFVLTGYSAWLTHIVSCAEDKLWGFLVTGAILFPVGVFHGIGVWFGAG
jgi:hypothetical protein